MSKVYANGRSVVHKGDGHVNTCPAPDACKTPTPGGPVPVPYVNVARDGDLDQGSSTVSIEGNPIALKDSNLSTSSGDEPGTAGGGLISSKTKGTMAWASASIDVKFEGEGVIRFMDICLHNGNTNNTGSQPQLGGGHMGTYPETTETSCPHCGQPMTGHPSFDIPQSDETRSLTAQFIADLEMKTGKPGDKVGKMVGILITNCPGPPPHRDTYAAVSGPPSQKKLLKGWENVASDSGFKTSPFPKDFVNLPSKLPITHTKSFGETEPGNCAAQKMLQHASKANCKPIAMTEAWFGGSKSSDRHTHNHSAASCSACRKNLPKMLCPNKPQEASAQ
jgi:hypothetical protein